MPSNSTDSNLLPKHLSQKYTVSSIAWPHFKHLLASIFPLLADRINFSRGPKSCCCCLVSDNSLFHLPKDMNCCACASSSKVMCQSNFCIFNLSLSSIASKLFENFYDLTYARCSDWMAF